MKKINKHGFTILEVLTVIVIITIIMMITLPLINSLSNRNKEELYQSYEEMMIEYVKASSLNSKDYVNLSEIEGLDQVKKECTGYVRIDHDVPIRYLAHIDCGDKYHSSKTDFNS